jgi:hypothetical protein
MVPDIGIRPIREQHSHQAHVPQIYSPHKRRYKLLRFGGIMKVLADIIWMSGAVRSDSSKSQ